MPRYRPVIVDVEDEGTFEIHLGQPGKPRVFRQRSNGVQRVDDDDPVLWKVAEAFKEGIEARRAFEEAEARKRGRWLYLLGRKLGAWALDAWLFLNRPIRWRR